MPTYTFSCSHSSHQNTNYEWDVFMSIVDPDPEECPQCKNKGHITRLITGSNFILQGQGWAKDSYSK